MIGAILRQTMVSHIQGQSLKTLMIFLFFKQASPRPVIMWLKDNVPVAKRVTISNSDGSSQLLIPSSERSDSGIYSIVVKNLAGQETLSAEVRVTGKIKQKLYICIILKDMLMDLCK